MSDPNEESLSVRPVPAVGSNPEESYGAFRETFLADMPDPKSNDVIRAFGKILNEIVWESRPRWPYEPLDTTAYLLQAGLVDLRYLQSHFADCGKEETFIEKDKGETNRHRALCQLSARLAKRLGALADDLEKEVGDWKFDV